MDKKSDRNIHELKKQFIQRSHQWKGKQKENQEE